MVVFLFGGEAERGADGYNQHDALRLDEWVTDNLPDREISYIPVRTGTQNKGQMEKGVCGGNKRKSHLDCRNW